MGHLASRPAWVSVLTHGLATQALPTTQLYGVHWAEQSYAGGVEGWGRSRRRVSHPGRVLPPLFLCLLAF